MPDIFTSSENPEKEELKKEAAPEISATPSQNIKAIAAKIPVLTKNPAQPLGLLSFFKINPTGIRFANQEDDEMIILFLRRHFITNVPWILLTLLLLIAPILITFLFQITDLTLFTIPQRLLVMMFAFYYLVIFNYALMRFIIWFYHVGIVTQRRLLDLDVYNILNHHLAETEIADIVDVSYQQRGFFQSFFNYGNVPIQTEAIKANFEFEDSPQPAQVSDIITDLRPRGGGRR